MNKYRVWVKLEAEFDDIEAENEDEAFIIASDYAIGGCDWDKEIELIEGEE